MNPVPLYLFIWAPEASASGILHYIFVATASTVHLTPEWSPIKVLTVWPKLLELV